MEQIGKISPIAPLAEIYRSGLTNEIMAIVKKYSPKKNCDFLYGENKLFRLSALCAIYDYIKQGGVIKDTEDICALCKTQKERNEKLN